MNRRYFYFKQRVTDDEMRDAFDGPEESLQNMAIDLNLFGLASGGDVTEHSPQNLSVDITGPMKAYDQAGQRIYSVTAQVLDCSEDYLGNQTVPQSSGYKRWISVHLRFDRSESDPRTDGNGIVRYWVQDESFELRVVSGIEKNDDSEVPPAKPNDAVLVCDIHLEYGDTAILNADIDETRKDELIATPASFVSVVTSSWTNIDNTSAHLQDALDSIDDELTAKDGSGNIEQSWIPDGDSTRALGSASAHWLGYLGDTEIDGDLLPKTTATDSLGSTSLRFLKGWFSQLDVSGAATLSGTVAVGDNLTMASAKHILPADATGQDLGDATHRFDVFAGGIDVSGEVDVGAAARIDGDLIPKADANELGSATLRWALYASDITNYNATIAGAHVMSAAKSVTLYEDLVPGYAGKLAAAGAFRMIQFTDGTSVGGRTMRQAWYQDSNIRNVVRIPVLKLIDGAVLQSWRLTWYQESSGDDDGLEAVLYRHGYKGDSTDTTSVGGTFISGVGAWKDNEVVASSLSHTVDLNSYYYTLCIYAAGDSATAIQSCVASFSHIQDVTDLGLAAIS